MKPSERPFPASVVSRSWTMAPMTDFASEREAMVERQLRRRGITEPEILDAFRAVPREAFVGRITRIWLMATIRCRSKPSRRSHSPTSSH